MIKVSIENNGLTEDSCHWGEGVVTTARTVQYKVTKAAPDIIIIVIRFALALTEMIQAGEMSIEAKN